MEVHYHPEFNRWLDMLATNSPDVHGEVLALIRAVREQGTDLAGPYSHDVVTAKYWLRALRRTPATPLTPNADGPPVLRILYAICQADGQLVAVVLFAGDKTDLNNRWYPPSIRTAEERLVRFCGMANLHPLPNRRGESG